MMYGFLAMLSGRTIIFDLIDLRGFCILILIKFDREFPCY